MESENLNSENTVAYFENIEDDKSYSISEKYEIPMAESEFAATYVQSIITDHSKSQGVTRHIKTTSGRTSAETTRVKTTVTAVTHNLIIKPVATAVNAVQDNISASGYCGDSVIWRLYSDGQLVISGKGDMYDNDTSIWNSYINDIKSVVIEDGVTSIGDNAFFNFAAIKSISIGRNVARIGDYAFTSCTGITDIVIPENVKSIDMYAFSYCFGLVNVKFLSSTTDIGENAFYRCLNLTSCDLPNDIKSIRNSAFSGCEKLSKVIIPDTVKSIGSGAFAGCKSLKNISIPDSVEYIYESAFAGCRGIISVTIGDGIKTIPVNCFYACDGLKTVTIGTHITEISDSAFDECTSLTDIHYAGTEKQWNEIIIGEKNKYLTDANIHYNYTE